MRYFILFTCFAVLVLENLFYSQKGNLSLELELNQLLDKWHIDAAKPNFEGYFEPTTENFVFLGTAPGERWNKNQFKKFAKPYFDAGKAWDFKPSNRKWIFSKNYKIAWFDEELETWMNTCRGSGVLVKEGNKWKLAYYNLTVLIENDKMPEFIKLREK